MRLLLRQATSEDEEFLFDVYASTRREEIAAWGGIRAPAGFFADAVPRSTPRVPGGVPGRG